MLGRGSGARAGVSWAALTSAARAVYGPVDVGELDHREEYVDAGEWVRRLAEVAGRPASDELSIRAAHEGFAEIAAARGRKEKERLLAELLRAATPAETAWLARNAVGEMRSGAQEGMLLEAIAHAAGLPAGTVRQALAAAGDVSRVAEAAVLGGEAGLAKLVVEVGRPVPPMLADSATGLADAWDRLGGEMALEWKLDGARIQIHRDGDRVSLWSRRMTEVTDRLPDVAQQIRDGLQTQQAILDGEVIVFGADGRPIPFQDVMRRWLRRTEAESAALHSPASVFLFDCLYVDGEALLDRPYAERWAVLERIRGPLDAIRRIVPGHETPRELALQRLEAFYDGAIAAGHEGVMAKSLSAPYAPGRRGSAWLKVKAETALDLVVIGADWGTGRRHRWLSNYHLAARDPSSGELLSVGETFKGLTDRELEWMTAELQKRQIAQRSGYVAVRPEIVVEVTFNGVQRSTRLPSGMALRFARITRIRDDKGPNDSDTLPTLRKMLDGEKA